MHTISDRLTIEEHNAKSIIIVNYTGLKESEMIELVNRHLELTCQAKLPFLADFQNTYVTPGYMVHARKFVEATKGIIDKGALLGVDRIKSFILKGVILMYGVNFKPFENKDQAIKF